jgi:hypothetical protein
MAVSGTVSTTVFTNRQVIDHAFRRCKLATQLITSEHMQIAKDVLYLLMSELVNKGIPLWTIEQNLLALYQGSTDVVCPEGTVDVLNLNLRQLQRLTGTATATEGDADNAFDSDLETDCTQTTPNGSITCEFAGPTSVCNFGLMPNATGTWDFVVETSVDGTTYTPIYTASDYSAVRGMWLWFDVTTPVTAQESEALNAVNFVRLRATGGTVLDVTEFFIGNMGSEIPMARINRDDWMNMPDKTFQGRPVQFWLDLQRDTPVIRLWPAVQLQYVFYQLVLQRRRYLMDVGNYQQTLDIPQRWYEAIVAELAARVAFEIQEVDAQMIPSLRGAADRALTVAWNGEGDSSPVYFRPNIGPYTR